MTINNNARPHGQALIPRNATAPLCIQMGAIPFRWKNLLYLVCPGKCLGPLIISEPNNYRKRHSCFGLRSSIILFYSASQKLIWFSDDSLVHTRKHPHISCGSGRHVFKDYGAAFRNYIGTMRRLLLFLLFGSG